MRSGFRLGRIFGIELHIDWSWFLIVLLVTWNLAAAVIPALHPGWGPGLNWLLALTAALLFFASVVAHELAHSLVARARGLPVNRITLFIFGGVSNLEREPASPATEFLMAIVGPLTSLIIGAVSLVLSGILTQANALQAGVTPGRMNQVLAAMGPLATLLAWLGPVNILLAVFNMVPGFPLDGGRVLRSLLWALTGNLRTATRWAAAVGHLVAGLFIVAGIAMIFGVRIPVLGTGFLAGLWLAFIGWFLHTAAIQSYQRVVVADVLEGVPVARVMRANAPSVPPTLSLAELVDRYLMQTDERAFPVVDGERLVGMVCLDDLRRVPRSMWDATLVSQVMTPAAQLEVAQPGDQVVDALGRLSARDVRQVPVVQQGRLVGVLRRRDILKWLQLQTEFGR